VRKPRLADPQSKARKQKKIAIAAAALLVAVLAFQVPSVLKQQNDKPVEPAPAPAATSADPGAAEGGASLASAVPEASAKVPADPDPAPRAQEGQLLAFNLFKSKDPFVQQLSAEAPAGGEAVAGSPPESAPPSSPSPSTPPTSTPPTSTPPTSTPPTSTPPTSTSPASTPPPSTPPPSTPPPSTPPSSMPPSEPPSSTPPAETRPPETPPASEPPANPPPSTEPPATRPPAPTAATISVNGVSEVVQVDAAFPKARPLFRLVAIEDGVAQIGIAGGTLQDGSRTVPIENGKTVTLMNTADGTRYVIKLVSIS
jgi:hypothetical protein